MRIFKKKRIAGDTGDPVAERFSAAVDLIKDLSKTDYNRLKDAMDSIHDAYQKVRKIKTVDDTVTTSDYILDKEVNNGGE